MCGSIASSSREAAWAVMCAAAGAMQEMGVVAVQVVLAAVVPVALEVTGTKAWAAMAPAAEGIVEAEEARPVLVVAVNPLVMRGRGRKEVESVSLAARMKRQESVATSSKAMSFLQQISLPSRSNLPRSPSPSRMR